MNTTLKQQRLTYIIALAVCLALAAMGECNAFLNWQTEPDSQQAFAVEILSVFATLAALPLAVKMKRTAKLWLVPLTCATVIISYYITLSTYAVLCLAIEAFALIYIYPKK